MCDFSVTVLDDRPGFVSEDRFPTARRRIAGPLRETVADLPVDQDTFVVLVTRGHSHDVECLLEVLDRPVGYIGMIGSQRRVDAVFQLLIEEMGMPAEKLDRRLRAHRRRHRRAHARRNRGVHHGRSGQRPAQRAGHLDLRSSTGARPAPPGSAGLTPSRGDAPQSRVALAPARPER